MAVRNCRAEKGDTHESLYIGGGWRHCEGYSESDTMRVMSTQPPSPPEYLARAQNSVWRVYSDTISGLFKTNGLRTWSYIRGNLEDSPPALYYSDVALAVEHHGWWRDTHHSCTSTSKTYVNKAITIFIFSIATNQPCLHSAVFPIMVSSIHLKSVLKNLLRKFVSLCSARPSDLEGRGTHFMA